MPRTYTMSEETTSPKEKHQRKLQRREHQQTTLLQLAQQEELFFETSITQAKDERTDIAKADIINAQRTTIDMEHDNKLTNTKPTVGYKQLAHNTTYGATTVLNRAFNKLLFTKQVTFRLCPGTRVYNKTEQAHAVHITYNLGADGHYLSKDDRKEAGLPILCKSTKRVQVANGKTSEATNVTQLPFPQLSD